MVAKIGRALAIVSVFTFSGFLIPAPAHAGTSGCIESYTSSTWDTRTEVCFEDYGEILHVSDWESDGYSAVGLIKVDEGNYFLTEKDYWNPNGRGSTRTFNLSFDEGTRLEIYPCIGEYGPREIYSCRVSPIVLYA